MCVCARIKLSFCTGLALEAVEPNWENIYCNVLCVPDKPRVNYILAWGPQVWDPIGLGLALIPCNFFNYSVFHKSLQSTDSKMEHKWFEFHIY